MVQFRIITPDYFRAMGRLSVGPALQRRTPTARRSSPSSTKRSPRRYWPDGDPIGTQVSFSRRESLLPNATPRFPRYTDRRRDRGSAAKRIGARPEAEAFIPFGQASNLTGSIHYLTARTIGDPMAAAAAIESAIRPHRSQRSGRRHATMESRSRIRSRSGAPSCCCSGGFAGLALAIAVVGLYGVMAYMVGQRRTELGLRAAMGATAAQLARMVIGDGMRMTLAGVALGLVLAGVLSRVLAAQLFQVDALDPLLYARRDACSSASPAWRAACRRIARCAPIRPACCAGSSETRRGSDPKMPFSRVFVPFVAPRLISVRSVAPRPPSLAKRRLNNRVIGIIACPRQPSLR